MANNYYIDLNTGDDTTGDGSTATPWRTIQKALDVTPAAGDNIYVRGNATGADAITASLIIKSSGSTTSPISLIGCTGSGTTWTEGTLGTVAVTKTGTVNQLLYDNNTGRSYWLFKNFEFYGATQRNIYMQSSSSGSNRYENVIIRNSANTYDGITAFSSIYINCRFNNNGSYGANCGSACIFYACYFYSNTTGGIFGSNNNNNMQIGNCIFYSQPYGYRFTGSSGCLRVAKCIFDSHTTRGLSIENAGPGTFYSYFINNIITNNSGVGVYFNTADYGQLIVINKNNAYYNNGTDVTNFVRDSSDITLSASPFVSASDFSLNTTAGGGASCRKVGLPSSIGGATVSNLVQPDIGAVQNIPDFPLDSEVQDGVKYDLDTKTGSYLSTVPAVSAVASDDYSVTTSDTITLSATVSNSPDNVAVEINGVRRGMANTGGTTYALTIAAGVFGVCAGETITVFATKSGQGGNQADGASTITITASNKTATLISEMSASLTAGGYTSTLSLVTEKEIGDTTPTIKSKIQIVYASASPTIAMIDAIRSLILASESSWTNVTSCLECSAVVNAGTDVTMQYKVEHT